ncbi:MAG: hypothetical protein RIA08_05265 [Roseovarius sp.]|uniref:hypothetical protein n=1 Tax=Roseobacteraceae TaxID=2854170 RepID=UPI0032ED6F3F
MHRVIAALAVLAAVAGCRGAGTDTAQPSVQAGHAQMVASLGNAYIWNCRLQSNRGNPDWQFVLQRVGRDKFSVVVLEAGHSQPRPIENLREDNAARVYFLRDGSRILVASDGEARGEGQGGSMGAEYTSGACARGGQPT